MRQLRRWLAAMALGWVVSVAAHAHLVASQRGTLNIVDNGAYMVLSLPVSAFAGIDDNGDGLLSIKELRVHAQSIESQVKGGVSLESDLGPLALEGVMLNTAPPDEYPKGSASHILVLGRFVLDPQADGLKFSLRLFGTRSTEQTEQITVTRGSETQLMTLAPEQHAQDVLPASGAVFGEQVRLGAMHVLLGADHLLFLLVVLATGWSLRSMALALTSFTAGHALTLVACAWFGLAVPSALVEPAIAATIIGMVLFDRWSQRNAMSHSHMVRLSLVFICALIHGLGLAGALTDLGLDPTRKALSLVGFNVGIETGQRSVAVLALLFIKAIQSLRGPVGLTLVTKLASHASLVIGSFWFVERVMAAV